MSDMINLAKTLGVDGLEFKSISLGSNVSSDEKIRRAQKFLPSFSFSRYKVKDKEIVLKFKPGFCSWLRQSVILWNGDVVPCCYDMEGQLVIGNALKDGGFMKIWRSDKYKKYRRNIIRRKITLCRNCSRTGEYSRSFDFSKNKIN
jgi:radical SAM protein with 4Fe4S-binding SPASM domain